MILDAACFKIVMLKTIDYFFINRLYLFRDSNNYEFSVMAGVIFNKIRSMFPLANEKSDHLTLRNTLQESPRERLCFLLLKAILKINITAY